MNVPHFKKWFQEEVLLSLLDKSAVVIDNTCHHSRIIEESKRPTTSWKKAALQEWLTEKAIYFQKKDSKPILLQKRELVPIVKKYKHEEETAEYCSESG